VAPCIVAANNYYYQRGGSESVYFSELEQLRGRGWKVVPFSMNHNLNRSSNWDAYFVDELDFTDSHTLLAKAKAASKLIYSFEAKSKFAKLIEQVRPDLVHFHNIYHHLSPSILPVVHSAGIPSVMTLHDLKVVCPAYTMLNRRGICERCKGGRLYSVVTQRCINRSLIQSSLIFVESSVHHLLRSYSNNIDRFIVPSMFYKNKLVEWGWTYASLTYIPNAVDVDEFRPSTNPGDYFVYVGRLSEEKGVRTLIDAVAISKARLVVVGTGPLENDLRSQASILGADVTFNGYLSGRPLHDAIGGARALVLPSEWYENAPISILEAYASGTPVLGARIGGIPELVSDGETGMLFESKNPDDLASKIALLRDMSDTHIREMRLSARAHAEQRFNKALHLERLLSLYAELGVNDATMDHSKGDKKVRA